MKKQPSNRVCQTNTNSTVVIHSRVIIPESRFISVSVSLDSQIEWQHSSDPLFAKQAQCPPGPGSSLR